MQLEEFNRLNLHDTVRYQGQLHTVVHLNRRTGKAYLRPTPGWGNIIGPVSCGYVLRVLGQSPVSDPVLFSQAPVCVSSPVPAQVRTIDSPRPAPMDDMTIDSPGSLLLDDATVDGPTHSGDTATDLVMPWVAS